MFLEKHINQKSLDTTHKMSLAALYAGKAINISKTTAPHAISYPFTSFFGVKHGQAVSFTLCDCLNYNYANLKFSKTPFNLKSRFNTIFKIFKVNSEFDLISKLNSTIKNIGLSTDIKGFNVRKIDDVNLILSNINQERLDNNPIKIDIDFVKTILSKKIS
jgi:alcohol dehydrogenase class IV